MALNRGTRKEKFLYFLEMFAILGTLAGIGLGIYNEFDGTRVDMLTGAFRFGLPGFLGGTGVGVAVGLLAIIWDTIFNR